MIESGEEGEAMHVHEDYESRPYQPLTLTSDQQQQFEEDLVLMTWKGVYSYEYMDSFERFQKPQLPPKDVFYSSLTEVDISEIDCTMPKECSTTSTWLTSEIITTSIFYLLFYVLFLFENFRNVPLQHYGLDPAHN